jgi:hypothetical protein
MAQLAMWSPPAAYMDLYDDPYYNVCRTHPTPECPNDAQRLLLHRWDISVTSTPQPFEPIATTTWGMYRNPYRDDFYTFWDDVGGPDAYWDDFGGPYLNNYYYRVRRRFRTYLSRDLCALCVSLRAFVTALL